MNQFQRRDGVADAAGQVFEVKILAFLLLRGLNTCKKFRIASNMNNCGAFDDIIFQYKRDDIWETSFLQLKYKKKAAHSLEPFTTPKSDFDLIKYLQSYHIIKQQFSRDNRKHPVFGGDFKHCSFLLYTNTVFNIKRELQHGHYLNEEIHNSGGSNGYVFDFNANNEENSFVFLVLKEFEQCRQSLSNILQKNGTNDKLDTTLLQEVNNLLNSLTRTELINLLQNVLKRPLRVALEDVIKELDYVSSIKSFLKRLKVYDGQADTQVLDNLVTKEIIKVCGTESHEVNTIFKEVIHHIKEWWKCGTVFLTEETEFWHNMMKSRLDRMKQLSEPKIRALKQLNITFRDSEIIPLNGSVVNVVADSSCTLISCSKLRQTLDSYGEKRYMLIDLQTLTHNKQEVLSLWPSCWCDTLVIDCGGIVEVPEVLHKLSHGHSLILVTINAIPGVNCVYFDTCRCDQLSKITRSALLEKYITFQGFEVQLKKMVNYNFELLNTVSADMVFELLQNGVNSEVGKVLKKPSFHYVKRNVMPYESHNNSILNSCSVWSLTERIILLSADPGVGKTTFMERIAIETKENDPTLWVVLVHLSQQSTLLDELTETGCTMEKAFDFLCEVAGKNCGSKFERESFLHAVRTSGRSVILFDAFDEINPTYTTKTLHLIQRVTESKVGKIYVAFRPVVREMLESLLGVHSFTLTPLTEDEQIEILYSFWSNCVNEEYTQKFMSRLSIEEVRNVRYVGKEKISDENPHQRVRRFSRRLIDKTHRKLSSNFCEVPLHLSLLAVVYEPHLVISLNDGGLYMSHKLDFINLYREFVEKKLSIYCSEKKDEDTSVSATLDDNELLRTMLMENYKISGVVELVPTNLLNQLSDKELKQGQKSS